jgi:hypothetical protein
MRWNLWFCWGTCTSVCDLYRKWVSISCDEICLIFLRNLRFGVRSLQYVSVDFVSWNLFDFAEASVCDLYREWVSVECFQCRLIFLLISADSSYYPLLFFGALHIILIVSLLRSCWLTVCKFATNCSLLFHLGSLISCISPLLVAQCRILYQCSFEWVF